VSKLWGGRFETATDREVEIFTESLSLDRRLAIADLRGCVAHARALGHAGVLTQAESETIIAGLLDLRGLFADGRAELRTEAEDIHSEIERLLTDRLGPLAGKLHTGRSRNDQVATACRLHLRDESDALAGDLRAFQNWLLETAKAHTETILPGTTHLQHAQPVSLAHHLMAYFWMFERDHERLTDTRKRINQLPLGSAALAGTPYTMDREAMASELGFDGLCENSLDAVSDRDFVVEFLSNCSLLATHLSRLSEEIILWSTPEFGFAELDDSVATGSSLMPQKKNPDVAELIRGRTGRAVGSLMGALTLLKGLPLSYNRDLQEDKFHLYQGLDNARACVRLMHLMLSKTKFRVERMSQATEGDGSTATDLADCLVKKGLPFRQAHEVAGKVVRYSLERKVALDKLSGEELKKFSPLLDASDSKIFTPRASLEARISRGGTSPASVTRQIALAEAKIGAQT
jgi:argininosuccinate lyase